MVSNDRLKDAEEATTPVSSKTGKFKIVKFKDFLDESEVDSVNLGWLTSRQDVSLIESGHFDAPGRLENGELAAKMETDKGTVGVTGWEVEV